MSFPISATVLSLPGDCSGKDGELKRSDRNGGDGKAQVCYESFRATMIIRGRVTGDWDDAPFGHVHPSYQRPLSIRSTVLVLSSLLLENNSKVTG